MDETSRRALQRNVKLRFEAKRLLGQAAWFMVESFGVFSDREGQA